MNVTPTATLAGLSLFFGDANEAEARVYARLKLNGSPAGLTLSGKLLGPECTYAETLLSTIPLLDKPGGPTLLAEAIAPDPCFWTPDLPMLYRVSVELRSAGELLDSAETLFGIRPLAARGRDLFFERERWVLRAAPLGELTSAPLRTCRELSAAVCCRAPTDAQCELASRLGVLLAVHLPADIDSAITELQRLARWPAVGVAIAPVGLQFPRGIRSVAPNLLLAEQFEAGASVTPAVWTQLVFCEVADPAQFAQAISECRLPVIAVERCATLPALAEARARCDNLQSRLAAHGDFAGYVIDTQPGR